MTTPVALIFYETLVPGSQLVNRLQDLGYRVVTINNPGLIPKEAAANQAFVAVVELEKQASQTCAAISALRQNAATAHVPVIAYSDGADKAIEASAQEAGANLIAAENAILTQLPRLLEHVLRVE